jgi:hypothetical protein
MMLDIVCSHHHAESISRNCEIFEQCCIVPETLRKIMFLGSIVHLVRGADNLTAMYEPIV